MRISIRKGAIEFSATLANYVDKRIRAALKHVEPHMRRIEVRLTDSNGERGGVDQEVRIIGELLSGRDVYAHAIGASAYHAVDAAARHLLAGVARRLGRSYAIERRALRNLRSVAT